MIYRKSSGFAPVLVLAAVVAIMVIGGASYVVVDEVRKNNNATTNSSDDAQQQESDDIADLNELDTAETESSESTGQSTNTNASANTNLKADAAVKYESNTLYEITLENNDTFYGTVTTVNDAYIRITLPFQKVSQGASTALSTYSSSLHGPEDFMYVRSENVSQAEVANDEIKSAITAYGAQTPSDSSTSESIESYIKSGSYQAVATVDGEMYFGKLSSNGGEFTLSGGVYTISGGEMSISLKSISSSKTIASSDVVYWQNLRADGQIASAITSYLK